MSSSSARAPKESRGAHFEEDHLGKDPEFGKLNLVVSQAADGSMALRQQALPVVRADLQAIIEEN